LRRNYWGPGPELFTQNGVEEAERRRAY